MRRQSKAAASTPEPTTAKDSTVRLETQPGKTSARAVAEAVVSGTLVNATLVTRFNQSLPKDTLDLTECMNVIKATVGEVQAGDLRAGEALLTGQAVALNAIFSEMARRAAVNMGEHLGATETYMRLALKAQSQCRATVETLAAMKNPPVVFARQANINHGGQLQVNNGAQAQGGASPALAPARESQPEQSKLLEASHGERLDFGAQGTAGGTHQELAPVGAVNGADERRRQGGGRAQRLEGRPPRPASGVAPRLE